ncbi:MAG: DUF3102 domain-containing protein [Clostridium sp.]|nr:DUF3102 domain-containing protein [Clostridium sp.]
MNELTEVRTLEIVAAEIRSYTWSMLTNIIEIGRRLTEAKEMLPHGEFINWCTENFGYSRSQTNNFMRLYDAYGSEQKSLFGAELNVQTFGHLNYSKALALLALPSPEEREEFVETHDVDNMTTRELQQAIKEKEEAEARAKQAEKATEEIRNEREALSLALKHAKDQVRELENRPVEVAVEKDEEAIAAAAKEAREQAEAEAAKKISGMETKLQKAEQDLEKAKKEAEQSGAAAKENIDTMMKEKEFLQKKLEDAQKQLKTSANDVNAFGIYYTRLQEDFSYMIAEYRKVMDRDPETGSKLQTAMRELLEYFRKEAGLEGT